MSELETAIKLYKAEIEKMKQLPQYVKDLQSENAQLKARCETLTIERDAAIKKNAPLFPDAETYFKVDNIEETLRAKDKQIAELESQLSDFEIDKNLPQDRSENYFKQIKQKDAQLANYKAALEDIANDSGGTPWEFAFEDLQETARAALAEGEGNDGI